MIDHDELISAYQKANPSLRMYEDTRPPAGAVFVDCPIENVIEGPEDNPGRDPCEGCPGWGYECAAFYRDPNCTSPKELKGSTT